MGISDNLWKLLQACWVEKSAERPTVKTVRELFQEPVRVEITRATPRKDYGVYSETNTSGSSGIRRSASIKERPKANPRPVSRLVVETWPSLILV